MRVSLFGYGKTTRSLAKEFSHVTFYDDKCNKPFVDDDGFAVRPSWEFDERYSDLEIPSPGIPPSHPLIGKAHNLISEYDYFASSMPRSIWISGTNGKTTTTQMTQFMLADRGAQSGGNIGTPLAELDKEAPLWILETSSFTLHYTNIAKPDIYLLLPITPDHLSWHGSMQAYEEAKLKPLSLMQEGEVAIVPKRYLGSESTAHLIGYESAEDLAEYFGIETAKIEFKGAFLLDAVMAMAVEKILFDTLSYERINAFEIEPHRQERFVDAKGRVWVNDTKATNIDATLAAVERFAQDGFVHLILGGDDKGVALEPLFERLAAYRLKTYHIGSNKHRLSKTASAFGVEHEECKNLQDAVCRIKRHLCSGEIALLSPAAASLDEFSSYAQRGELFKSYVKEEN